MNNTDTLTLRKLKLLFLDNSRTTRAVMSVFLNQQGFEVIAVSTGQEAIDKVQSESFDVAIMDLYMPFMNGYEAAKLIRALSHECKDIPIIDICKNAGMNEYVIKSEDHKDLLEVLKRYQQQPKA